jgi:Ca2+-binding RTX toxin-like protein
MPRVQRGPIDELGGYTILYLNGPTLPQDDYYTIGTPSGTVTFWGVGLISFGLPTSQQTDWMANLANNSDPSTFPGDWVSFGFSTPVQQAGEVEIWPGGAWIAGVLISDQGVFGGDSWSIGGLTSSPGGSDFYWSDIAVTNGTAASETLNGSNGAETLNGLSGDDTLNGGAGADALHGGTGDDHLIGGAGIDRLFGDDGNDRLEPGTEQIDQNFISTNPAADSVIDGGAGFDTLVLDYSGSSDSIVLSADQLLARPGIVNIEAVDLTGSAFSDSLSGSPAGDRLLGGGGFDVLRGGGGDDWLDAGAPGASSVGAIHTGGNSVATAVPLDDLFTAGSGSPTVTLSLTEPPRALTDLWGIQQPTPMTFSFNVAAAGDQMTIDYAILTNEIAFDFIITDADGVEVETMPFNQPVVFPHEGIYYLNVILYSTNVWSNAIMNVTLSLDSADPLASNMLYGGAGNDTYVVYSVTDQVIENPGEGTDTVRSSVSFALASNIENLTLTGISAINGTGNGLANVITGNAAANVITGGGGGDTLTGGAGADLFTFTAVSDSAPGAADLITDFTGGRKGGDKIDLSAIDANTNTLANDAFHLVKGFTGHAAELYASYDKGSGMTNVYLDVDGNGSADMVIHLSGHLNLTSGDFIL